MSDWKQCLLGSIAEVQTGPFGSQLKNEQYITGGTPVITVEHINAFRIQNIDYPSVTEDDRQRLARYSLNAGDIVFTRVGSVDLSAYVKPENQGWLFSSRMLRVRVSTVEVDSLFLSYFFRQEKFREYILNIAVGATMPSINTQILKDIPISYPPLPEQKAIASVLSSLDDKIDLLHRQNKTLEAMAETLFRQWFIEEAKEDWEGFSVSDIAIHVKDNVNPSKDPLKTFYHFSLPAFDSGQKPTIEVGSDILSNKYRVAENSILISKLNPRVPRVWLLTNAEENYVCSTEFQNLKPKVAPHLMFLYSLFSSRNVIDELTMSASGTSGSHQRVKPEDMLNVTFRTPSLDYLEEYSLLITPSMEKVSFNKKQIQTLENLRDTLLPKLMSGEVRVQYQTEEVA